MGGGGSKPRVDPYPKQESLDGVSIAKAQGCTECRLMVPAGVSSASVRLQRTVANPKFSSQTKMLITPALAFEVQFNGESIPVKSMTLYHPCPIRIENIQYDAVLCLNDPGLSFIAGEGSSDYATHQQPSTVLLVPIKAENNPDKRAAFFSRFVPYMSALKEPKPDDKTYATIDVPVGKDWSLTTLFPVALTDTGASEVTSGLFGWKGGTGEYSPKIIIERGWTLSARTIWEPVGNTPYYVMLENAVPISTADLQTITSTLPPTPFRPPFPIHPVSKTFVYKPCEKPKKASPVKETFENAECDPFGPNAKYPPSPINADAMFGFAATIMMIVALVLIVWGVMKLSDNPFWDKVKGLGEYLGKGLAKAFKGAKRAAEEQAAGPEEETKTAE